MRTFFKLLLPFLFLASCSVSEQVATDGPFQKRKYRPGWHISLSGAEGGGAKVSGERSELPAARKRLPSVGMPATKIQEVGEPVEKGAPAKKAQEDSCDLITKEGGEKIQAKVEDITQEKVRYKRCDHPDGPTYTIQRSSVIRIDYPGGGSDVFQRGSKGSGEGTSKKKASESSSGTESDDSVGREEVFGLILSVGAVALALLGSFGTLLLAFLIAVPAIILCYPGDNAVGIIGLIFSIGVILYILVLIALVLMVLSSIFI